LQRKKSERDNAKPMDFSIVAMKILIVAQSIEEYIPFEEIENFIL
jgi:hypothetical protein